MACSRLLDQHMVVQPFQTAIFLGPDETPASHGTAYAPLESFAAAYCRGGRATLVDSPNVLKSHPGYVWAARRSALVKMGLFYDRCILGHGDIVMGLAFSHNPERYGAIADRWDAHWDPGWSLALKKDVREWQRRASEVVKGDVSFLPGRIYHLYHGSNKSRAYGQRGKILKDFDPAVHLGEDKGSGMWTWTEAAHAEGLPEAAHRYFRLRCEDQ